MKRVTMYQTFDGFRHDTPRDAEKHLDKKLGELITPLAHKFSGIPYKDVHKAILESTSVFLQIKEIQNDMVLAPEEDE